MKLLSHLHVGSGLQEMLLHVILEVVEQLHLLLQGGGEVVQGVVMLTGFVVNVMDVPEKER